jgi:Rrf2 family protein
LRQAALVDMNEKGYLTELLGFAILDSNIREFRVTGPAGAFVSGANFMRLTTKGRFAVTAMIDLALRQGKGPVTLSAISERQEISLSYLEQLFGKLRRHQIVESVRGPGGGYNLARKAADVSVADIIIAVDEPWMRPSAAARKTATARPIPAARAA